MSEPQERLHPANEKQVGKYAKKLHNYRQDIFVFVYDMWKLKPQGVKPEYQEQWEEVLRSTGETWMRLKDTVTAEWFGDCLGTDEEGVIMWKWYDFEKGKNLTWQQTLILLSVNKSKDKRVPSMISIASGHGIGKSATCAWIVLWFLYCYIRAQVPVTAPTASQMNDVLWKEMALWIQRMPAEVQPLYEWTNGYIRITHDPETWFARARTSTKENTEAIAGVHSDHVCIVCDEACHDEKTEVLTENGWKLFKDVANTDRVYSVNEKTGKATLELPTHYHEYDHDGEMISLQKRGHDFCVTPNHDMYVRTKKGGYRKKPAGSFTKNSDYFYQRTMDWDGNDDMSRNRVAIYAWFLSEGNLAWYKDRTKGPHTVCISQSKAHNRANYNEIVSLVKSLGFEPKCYKDSIKIHDVWLARELYQECGDGSLEKRVPNRIKMLNKELLTVFLDTYVKGDGYHHGNQDIIYTSSKLMADDIQEIIIKTGCNATIGVRNAKGVPKWVLNHWATSHNDNYIVRRSKKSTTGKINGLELKREYYKGKVYCLTVPSGLLLTRRNGYVMWSGNSGVPEQVYDAAEGALTSGNVLVILISNPTRTIGYFYNSHHGAKSIFQTFKFDGEQTPMVDRKYILLKLRHGRTSQEFGIRVTGIFPKEDAMDDTGYMQLISRSRVIVTPDVPSGSTPFLGRVVLGLDPSGEGKDEYTLVARDDFRAKVVDELASTNENQIAERALIWIDRLGVRSGDLVIDGFGVGTRIGQKIIGATQGKFEPYVALVGNAPKKEEEIQGIFFTRLDEEMMQAREDMTEAWIESSERQTPDDLYLNIRALMYFRLRKWLLGGGQIVDNDTEDSHTVEEIMGIRYKRSLQGNKIQLMSKKEMLKLRIKSPNRADALALTMLRHGTISTQSREEAEAITRQESQFDPLDII